MSKQFTMSMYASRQDLYEAKSKYYMEQCEQLQKENEELKLELISRFGEMQTLLEENDELKVHVDSIETLSVWSWMSAALEDEAVCAEMKRDIEEAFNRVALTPAQSLRHIESRIADRQCSELAAQVEEETIERCADYMKYDAHTKLAEMPCYKALRHMPRKYKEQSDED